MSNFYSTENGYFPSILFFKFQRGVYSGGIVGHISYSMNKIQGG